MRRFLAGTVAMLALVACKGEVHEAARVVEGPGVEPIRIEAKTIDDTSIAFATRAVGWESKRGAVLSLKVGARPLLILQKLSDAERAPTEEETKALVAGVETRWSSDGQHLLVSWKLDEARRELFHLFPGGGPPFQLATPKVQAALGPKSDLDALPGCVDLALEALTLAARAPDCAVPGAHLFWQALSYGAGGTKLEMPLLVLWPGCSNAWGPVDNLAHDKGSVSTEFKSALKAKREAIIAAGGPTKHLRQVLEMCLYIEDTACADEAATKLAPLWPADWDVHNLVMQSFDKLPKVMRDAILAEALADKRFESFEDGARRFRFMRRWATCEQFKAFGQLHLDVSHERSDCHAWPLKRFPEEGQAVDGLRALLAVGDRNGAIKYVRRTTGWEYSRAVEFVDRQTEKQKAATE